LRKVHRARNLSVTPAATLFGDRMESLRIAIASLALSGALAAQQQPAAPQANPIMTAFRARILASHRNIAQAFDSIPASKFDYKPTPAQLTFGYIAQHVASDSYLFCSNFGAMKPALAEKETATPDSVKARWPKDELVSQLKASFTFCAQALDQVTDAALPDSVTFSFGGRCHRRCEIAQNRRLKLYTG
jgi:hypothetical protein